MIKFLEPVALLQATGVHRMLLFSTVLYRYPQRSRSQKQCKNQSVPVIIKHLIPRWNSGLPVNTENAEKNLKKKKRDPLEPILSPRFTSPRFTTPRLTSPRFTSPRFTSPRFTSLRFTSPRFTSPVPSSPVDKIQYASICNKKLQKLSLGPPGNRHHQPIIL